MNQKKTLTPEEALLKLQRFCAYQDRCHQDVRSKLIELGVYGDTLESVLAELISDGFLNEERFARSFVRGKFRIKRWGRQKIRQGLLQRQIPDAIIRIALQEIDSEEYALTLAHLLDQKAAMLPPDEPGQRTQKLFAYAASRGYETELIWEFLKEKNR
ncbi:MAG: RecX family transcriptional regulator [Lewinellaceae bacterium]|nr:RecX family transcriptional regulator [Lewinella sp.]MCB9277617.1 RecX family transcriptional regulator [Lewinellaceae bacterium]